MLGQSPSADATAAGKALVVQDFLVYSAGLLRTAGVVGGLGFL